MSMPPVFQNIEDKCFGYAVDRQLAKVMEKTKSVAVWADMDSVDARYYGYMAAMLRSPYFLSSLWESDKIKTIKTTPPEKQSDRFDLFGCFFARVGKGEHKWAKNIKTL